MKKNLKGSMAAHLIPKFDNYRLFLNIVLINVGMHNKEWPGSLYCVSNPSYVVYTIYA